MNIILISIILSESQKIISAINKKLQGTTIEGQAGFILSISLALIVAAIKIFFIDHQVINWNNFGSVFSEVWAMSQIYFKLITQKLNLNIPSSSTQVEGQSLEVANDLKADE